MMSMEKGNGSVVLVVVMAAVVVSVKEIGGITGNRCCSTTLTMRDLNNNSIAADVEEVMEISAHSRVA